MSEGLVHSVATVANFLHRMPTALASSRRSHSLSGASDDTSSPRFSDWLEQADCLITSLAEYPATEMTVHAALARDSIRFNWRQILDRVARHEVGGWFFVPSTARLADQITQEAAAISQQLYVLAVEAPQLGSPLLEGVVKQLRVLFLDLQQQQQEPLK